jgi:DNA polymerase-3 subunit gamma/tau
MSYQVIARKWRPQTFEEVTGQELITQTLRNAIEHDRLHHAYLFSGARGVGKTTTARILAKALNCRKTDGPNVHPCRTAGEDACVSCIEIAESRSMDVLEFDAASNTQVEKIREIILENINITPARDRFKIFIIDEVHMLSPSSFNALLKTVEEPPPNVVFVMATTELHKVPDTIASRTQQFEFRTIPLQKIYDRLKLIAQAEGIEVSEEALREIARSGDGSMRDAQSNFDQVISFCSGRIETGDVTDALGLAGRELLTRVLDSIRDNRPAEVLSIVEELSSRGHDLRNFCRDLLGLLRDLLVMKLGGDASLAETSILDGEELKRRSTDFSEADIVRFFQSLAETETRLKAAAQPRYLLEIGLVRLVEMRRMAPIESVLKRLAEIEALLETSDPMPLAANASAAGSSEAQPEKKTPKSDVAAVTRSTTDISDASTAVGPSESGLSFRGEAQVAHLMRFRLPPIASEELVHVEDRWLDDAYDRKLEQSGDDLGPIRIEIPWANISNGERVAQVDSFQIRSGLGSGGAAAVALAMAEVVAPPDTYPIELHRLSETATEEELLSYAQGHPAVRAALRVFRGKLVGTRRVATDL